MCVKVVKMLANIRFILYLSGVKQLNGKDYAYIHYYLCDYLCC